MLIAKSRLQGNAVVVTLPPKDGKKPEPNKEYLVEYSKDGTILLIPKIADPFAAATIGEFYEEDKWSDMQPEGRELG
ncbi:type II toxin-antitoxin system PemI/MazE family antitoxin [Enterococcus sp. AZ163]|uniref:type II toxin-antitoxin system PemI/MazE family antitoxin n=1 Tax=Enterococcus sp. AZ163 TaxID=2774638 RepID=UPI003D29B88D